MYGCVCPKKNYFVYNYGLMAVILKIAHCPILNTCTVIMSISHILRDHWADSFKPQRGTLTFACYIGSLLTLNFNPQKIPTIFDISPKILVRFAIPQNIPSPHRNQWCWQNWHTPEIVEKILNQKKTTVKFKILTPKNRVSLCSR